MRMLAFLLLIPALCFAQIPFSELMNTVAAVRNGYPYPKVPISGVLPPVGSSESIPVLVDANNVVIGEVAGSTSGGHPYILLKDHRDFGEYTYELAVFNDTDSNSVQIAAKRSHYLFFELNDCRGLPFYSGYAQIRRLGDLYFVPLSNTAKPKKRFKSRARSAWIGDTYFPSSECENIEIIQSAFPLTQYLPAQELLQARYPVRID